ncbi:hypothetical protein COU80_00930 [Candidatus Peregrinibacteria bacterium CG10_big_fil_rev_8_21_14_0_10_55_24]|nr:MAG: hypothetical protein COU80_00930 [Candidatus Peregrinibacteria bacterium CG10_big_fil_rev_8_21_14_0_10_55_24]
MSASSSSTILKTLSNITASLADTPASKHQLLLGALAREGVEHSPSTHSLQDLEAQVIEIKKNTDQRLIIVSQDKILLCLRRNLVHLGRHEWIAPLSTVSTILIALITSDFKSALWLSPAEWKAMFVIAGMLSTGWLAFSLRRSLRTKDVNEVVHDVCTQLGGCMTLADA